MGKQVFCRSTGRIELIKVLLEYKAFEVIKIISQRPTTVSFHDIVEAF